MFILLRNFKGGTPAVFHMKSAPHTESCSGREDSFITVSAALIPDDVIGVISVFSEGLKQRSVTLQSLKEAGI